MTIEELRQVDTGLLSDSALRAHREVLRKREECQAQEERTSDNVNQRGHEQGQTQRTCQADSGTGGAAQSQNDQAKASLQVPPRQSESAEELQSHAELLTRPGSSAGHTSLSSSTLCRKCGKQNERDARFCSNCGSSLTAGDAETHCASQHTDLKGLAEITAYALLAIVICSGLIAGSLFFPFFKYRYDDTISVFNLVCESSSIFDGNILFVGLISLAVVAYYLGRMIMFDTTLDGSTQKDITYQHYAWTIPLFLIFPVVIFLSHKAYFDWEAVLIANLLISPIIVSSIIISLKIRGSGYDSRLLSLNYLGFDLVYRLGVFCYYIYMAMAIHKDHCKPLAGFYFGIVSLIVSSLVLVEMIRNREFWTRTDWG